MIAAYRGGGTFFGAATGPTTDATHRKDFRTSYDQVADEYARRIFDELQHKPLDRQLLDRFAASVRGSAWHVIWAVGRDTSRAICATRA
ncbi:MAG TPA: hypothetical protein VMV72_13040 [Verrucomicrobiae bacterium]|nr:hypothetical protein [Verrucomicrobiae bacterium]